MLGDNAPARTPEVPKPIRLPFVVGMVHGKVQWVVFRPLKDKTGPLVDSEAFPRTASAGKLADIVTGVLVRRRGTSDTKRSVD